ncbi:tRNA nuclease CdiA [Saezia sanguinis]|uniref:tRNA nuclease CdiA n=1 Tax=Saezia sanguinis TaxID=1965230 RepID=A0A433SGB9_9BURK|nr:hemagglutinin repeat-containing protein [Saezia sanguinis]RUS67788.1 tRNA nuclease CdiA [Saezia sanguinis]
MKHHATLFFKAAQPRHIRPNKSSSLKRLGCLVLSLTVAFTPLSPAIAQVVADPNAGQYRPGMGSAANSVPVVNITAPSAAGVSRNQYHQFNVQRQGVILNNSTVNTQTQLGGWVQGNPNLSYGAARVILNEVTSGNPSLLQGYIEVGGQRAEVIIANPAGISVDGAGFINAAGVTLTTGTPVFNNSGNLESYRVGGGRVSIGGAGLDTSTADYTRIISRAVEINSGLWANDLTMAAGTGSFAPDGTPLQLTVEDEHGKPLYAIDVAQLGGMYAGKIRLIGTEHGVGVRNAGHIGAQAGQVTVTADGMLVNSGTINSSHTVAESSGIQVAAASGISNTGSLYTQGQLVLNSNGTLFNQGTLAALGNVSLNAQNIQNTTDGLIAAGMDSNGTFNTEGQLNATAQQILTNQGQILSGGSSIVQAGVLTNTGATIHAGKDLNITADTIHNQQADLLASGNLHIQGNTLNSSLNNQNGLISAAGQVDVSTGSIDNHAGVIISGGDLGITTGNLTGAGQILTEANADIVIQGDYTAEAGNQIIADGNLTLNIDGTLTNAGDILAGNTASITAHNIDNLFGGEISAGTNQITATGTNAGTFTNRGLIDGILTYITADALTNLGSGRIYGNHIGIQAGTLTNRDESGQSGVIAARERMDIGVGTLNNLNGAVLFSAGDMSIGGSLDSNHIAQGSANLVYNDGAVIEALSDMQIAADSIENRNTAFASQMSAEQKVGAVLTFILGNGQRYGFDEILIYNHADRSLKAITADDLANYTSAQILSKLVSDFGGTDTRYALVLPSSQYPLDIFGPANGMDYAPTVPAYVPQRYDMENITTIPEQINYDYDSPYWALFGVQAPDAPMPEHPGFICAQGHPCDAGQQRQYNEYLAELQPWKDRNLALYLQLNAKLQDYMQNGFNTTSEFYVEGYDILGSHSVVTASNPGQISAGGNMLLDGNLVNDKSRIQAGSTIVTTGNVTTIDAKSQDTTRHHGFSSYSYIRQSNGGDDERRWNHTPLDVTLPVTETTLVVATPQQNTTVQGSGTQIAATPQVQLPGGDLIQAASPNTRIPASSLYQINPGNSKNYLVETDSRFASYGTWLTSDYMLSALGLDPAATQKRLGDGFYEQQLIREQIGQLTGYRYLAGYLSDEAQYQALMNAGVEFAQAYNLTVGVALTAEQMAQLTGDIVWLVSTEVTLPDGSTETVLVPQLYTRASTAMITAGGSLISANNIYITGQDGNPVTLNNNATIAGREGLFVDVAYLQNKVGQLHGGDVVLRSASDIDNIGGTISGDNSITLAAARDINIISTTADGKDAMGRIHGISNVASVYLSGREVLTSGQPIDPPPEEQPASRSASADTATSEQSSSNQGQILLNAGRDINMRAGYIGNDATVTSSAEDGTQTSTGGVTTLAAGHNIDIGTVDTEQSHLTLFDAKNWRNEENRTEVGSQIQGTGDINLIAGDTLHTRASGIQSNTGAINAVADTITIEAGDSYHSDGFSVTRNVTGGLSSGTQHNIDLYSQNDQVGSTLSAEQINLQSRGDTTIQASSVVATHDVNLISEAGNINIIAGTANSHEYHYEHITETGVLSSNVSSFTVGRQQTTTTQTIDEQRAVGSTVGSLEGNVNILAQQGSYNQVGSDVIARQGDINVVAQDINVVEARETRREENTYKSSQSSVSIGVSSSLMSTAQFAQNMAETADRTDDSRMQALAGGAVAFNAYNTYSDIMQNGGEAPNASLSISYGSSKAESYSLQNDNTAKGSTMSAGGNINLIATGRPETTQSTDEQPTYSGGNILIQGSDISADGNILLLANDRIDIRAAANTSTEYSKNSSSSWSAGVSYGMGGMGGWGGSASASQSSGSGYGADQSWTASHVSAGDTLTLVSGGDTNIIGSQIAGNTVKADIDGNLNIETLQDSSFHTSHSSSSSISASTQQGSSGGAMGGSKAQASGAYISAQEYAGIMAGDGGFDITVAGNTDLKGAIIASTQQAVDDNKNQLTTGSLTTSDLINASSYDAKGNSISAGMQGGMHENGTFNGTPSGNMMGYTSDSGSDSSITIAGISTGSITITNEDEQLRRTGQTAEEAIAAINDSVRTGQSVNGIEKNWDIDQLMSNMEAGGEITAAFGQQAAMGVANFATNQQKTIMAEMMLVEDKDSPEGQAKMAELQQELERWGEGGAYRVLAHTIVGGLTGDWSGAAGAGSSALIADQLSTMTADLPPGVKEAVGAGLASGLGYLTGGEGGASTAFNQDTNNRQLHRQERDLIRELAREKATNEQGELDQNQYAYWLGIYEMAGRQLVSEQGGQENLEYFALLEYALSLDITRPTDGQHQASVQRTYDNFAYALQSLQDSPYYNQPIQTTNGGTYTWDGVTQTYFNATPEQKANEMVGWLPSNNGHIDPLFDDRRNDYVKVLTTPYGSVESVYPEAYLIGAGGLLQSIGKSTLNSLLSTTGSRTLGEWVIAYEIKAGAGAYTGNSSALWALSSGTTQLDMSLVRLGYRPSSGVMLESIPGRTTTILGNYREDMRHIIGELGNIKSTNFGPQTGRFNVLNTPDELYVTPKQFWAEYNQPWLSNTVKREDAILMATKPEFGAANSILVRFNQNTKMYELSGFGREYFYLRQQGYKYNPLTNRMER